MKTPASASALLYAHLLSHGRGVQSVMIGDEICITGYVMDRFSINSGYLLDNSEVVTLEHPEKHSYHTLLYVDLCYESGYVVLTERNLETGLHGLGYRLEETVTVLQVGRVTGRYGQCESCTGDDSKPEYGYRATIAGTVSDVGDGSDGVPGTPTLERITVQDKSIKCPAPALILDQETPLPSNNLPSQSEATIQVGDEVCITNFVMDQFCINLGNLLDNDSVVTLEGPEEHSFHCLLDPHVCRDSGYVVLTDKDSETGMHCLGYRLEDTDAVVAADSAAGQHGYCDICTGDESKPEYGFRATFKGTTVKELGDGSDGITGTPILDNITVIDESVEKSATTVANPVFIASAPQDASDTDDDDDDDDDDTPGVSPANDLGLPIKNCFEEYCDYALEAENYKLRYMINVPADTTESVCDGCTISMEVTYDGEAWVGIGFSRDGKMVGSEAVLGLPSESSVLKYNLAAKSPDGVQPMPQGQQTLSETSVVVENGKTVMRFTKIMKEEGEIEITTKDNTFLWAYGSGNALGYHAQRKSFELNLSSGASEAIAFPNKATWLAHGIMAFLAWGVFVSFAVQSSLLSDLLPSGPLLFQLHRGFNSLSVALFFAVFAVAVSFTGKEGGTHFINSHQKMGLAMFIMASAQVAGGIFRPHLPAPDSGEEKTSVRKGWEVGHRVLGVTLLACGFWQMSAGVNLYSIKYSVDGDKLMIAYWVRISVMTAVIVIVIVIGGGYFKLKNASSNSLKGGVYSGGDVP
ncbi:hypothetical protein ACHAWF_004885 [Thalassiosira exigua]